MKREIGKIEKILIRQPNWVGDNIFTIPAVQELRRRFPRAHLAIVTRDSIAELWKLVAEIDEVITFDFRGGFRDFKAKGNLVRLLKRKHFDLAVIFPRSFEAALLVYWARIPRRWGYRSDCRSILLTRRPICSAGYRRTHRADYYYRLLGNGDEVFQAPPAKLAVTLELRKRSLALLRTESAEIDENKLIGLHPWASYGPAKCWPADNFAALSRLLVEKLGVTVVIFGGSSDRAPAEKLIRAAGEGVVNLTGKTDLDELAGLISLCRGFVANDSGPLHLAAALGVPTVGLFGSSDPAATSPRGGAVRTIFKNIPCSPCLKAVCPTDFKCMTTITPEEVFSQLKELMAAD